jgi:excisionase family DNA binding protein
MSKRTRGTTAAPPQTEGTQPVIGEARQRDRIEILVNGVRVEVSPELEAAVHRAYKGLAQPLPTEMTTNQAADFLDVSRPFVIKLIKQGELPCRMVGKHRRVPTAALLAHREKMYQRAKKAADEIAELSEGLD